MSSGNYQKWYPENWFDFNRNNIIDAFNSKPKTKKRKASIQALKNKIKKLEEMDQKEWHVFRKQCIKTESIE